MTTYHCPKCKTEHVRIQQAVPDKPRGISRGDVLDFVVIVMVFISLLLWIGVAS